MRLALTGLLGCLAAATALAQAPRFEDIAGRELQGLLGAGGVALSPGAPAHPVFYAETPNRVEEVHCEQTAAFGLIARANLAGQVLVAVCEQESARVRALARDARRGLAAILDELRKGGARIDEAAAQAAWNYRRVAAPDGEEHHFPVLLIGHGVLGPQTVVWAPRADRRTVVIQADVQRHCQDAGLQGTALCTGTRALLARLGRQVLARLPR